MNMNRRATDLLLDAAQESARQVATQQSVTLRIGKVLTVDTTARTMSVELLGTTVRAVPYMRSYTPAVNDVVWLLHQNSLLIAIGTP
jgi:hypothetical protein